MKVCVFTLCNIVFNNTHTQNLILLNVSREKERQMHEIIKEIVVCMLYLFLILLLAYTNRDLWSFRMNVNYNNIFNKGDFEGAITGSRQSFENVCVFYLDFLLSKYTD